MTAVTELSGYYAPLSVARTIQWKAWTLDIGQTPDGKWVVQYQSIASPRYERRYFDTEAEATTEAEAFVS